MNNDMYLYMLLDCIPDHEGDFLDDPSLTIYGPTTLEAAKALLEPGTIFTRNRMFSLLLKVEEMKFYEGGEGILNKSRLNSIDALSVSTYCDTDSVRKSEEVEVCPH